MSFGLQVPPNCDLTLGMVCTEKTEAGRTVWRVVAHERFCNPLGVIQGGFVAACCDSAMGASAVTFAAGRPVRVANAEMKVTFLRPVRPGAALTCEATVVSGGRRVAFVEATLRAAGGELVARATSTYLYSERR
ncbi:MAG TPA: PaaI family thioesterase [Acidimicrobiales bacterium]|nr:PaaI family thioesterase [Acidimicrobiales bacterium]